MFEIARLSRRFLHEYAKDDRMAGPGGNGRAIDAHEMVASGGDTLQLVHDYSYCMVPGPGGFFSSYLFTIQRKGIVYPFSPANQADKGIFLNSSMKLDVYSTQRRIISSPLLFVAPLGSPMTPVSVSSFDILNISTW